MITDLVIASFRIRLQTSGDEVICLTERFAAFRPAEEGTPDLTVDIISSKFVIPAGAKKVFEAPLLEETSGKPENTGKPFWDVYSDNDMIYVLCRAGDPQREPVLAVNRSLPGWAIYTDAMPGNPDTLPYPLDGLLLYYLAVFHKAIMIHASGVVTGDRGWLFTGRSGAGKTTIAGIMDRAGDTVIHDDRLILVRNKAGWIMHNTPVYRNDVPRCSPVSHIWITGHGKTNISAPVTGAEAAALVMANCIQQTWDREMTLQMASLVEDLVMSVSVSRLSFVPDRTVRDYLLVHDDREAKSIFRVAASMLERGEPVSIIAGGYSMWPAIKPGDRIVIQPLTSDKQLAPGIVAALRRDGGFVAHRIITLKETPEGIWVQTRGDSNATADPWVTIDGITGVVSEVVAGDKRKRVSDRRMPFVVNRALSTAARLSKRLIRLVTKA